jgi:hypothetical protein
MPPSTLPGLHPCPGYAATASAAWRIDAVTASGRETLSAWDAPGTSRWPLAAGQVGHEAVQGDRDVEVSSLKTNHAGIAVHAGVPVGSPAVRAMSVTGRRWVALITPARAEGT